MTAIPSEPWLQSDGEPIACREKLRVLAENQAELTQIMHDAFEDAVLMGVDVNVMRARLHALVDRLENPRQQ